MAEPKTQRTKASVAQFIAAVADETRRKDAKAIDKMMRGITGEKPKMWGPSIVGYGIYRSPSGDWPITGFSPRRANLVLYVMPGLEAFAPQLAKLGKHKTGKSCLYISKLADVDEAVLRQIVERGVLHMRAKYKLS